MNDKKKTLVIAGLGAVLVAVGAFQFIPRKSAPAVVPLTKAAASPTVGVHKGDVAMADPDPQKDLLRAMVKNPLARRDPFEPQIQPVVTDAPATTAAAGASKPAPSPAPRPKPTWRPSASAFRQPPVDPMAGSLPPIGGSEVNVAKGAPLRAPGEFAFKVKGVIVGKKPMAVFEDDQGNQRLVPLGGSVGSGKVVGIERGKVRIRNQGKEKTLEPLEGQ